MYTISSRCTEPMGPFPKIAHAVGLMEPRGPSTGTVCEPLEKKKSPGAAGGQPSRQAWWCSEGKTHSFDPKPRGW